MVLGFADGRTEHADVVVGADGIRSTVRRWVVGDGIGGAPSCSARPPTGMLPHQGQGANTTVEDAFTLAALLAEVPDTLDLPAALAAYQALRRGRKRRIQRLSWLTNTLLRLPDGRAAEERDRALARFPQDIAWIHDYNVRSALRRRPSHSA